METPSNQLKGAIIGLAVGDALGVPVEFLSREMLDQNPVVDMRSGGTHGQVAGTWSDDTSLTLCLMSSLTSGKFDTHEIASNFLAWMRDGYWTPHESVFDRGMATTSAIQRFEKGMTAELSGGMSVDDNGNGSLMRILPMAFITHSSSINDRYEKVKNASSITHAHFRSVFSCFIYTEYARLLLAGMEKFSAYEAMIRDVDSFVLNNDFNPTEVGYFNRILSGTIHELDRSEISGSGYVLHTLEASMWCFLTTDNYSEATLKAVNLGDDTDTTGAVTGGLAGLYYGMDQIPKEWVNVLARLDGIERLIEDFGKSLTHFND